MFNAQRNGFLMYSSSWPAPLRDNHTLVPLLSPCPALPAPAFLGALHHVPGAPKARAGGHHPQSQQAIASQESRDGLLTVPGEGAGLPGRATSTGPVTPRVQAPAGGEGGAWPRTSSSTWRGRTSACLSPASSETRPTLALRRLTHRRTQRGAEAPARGAELRGASWELRGPACLWVCLAAELSLGGLTSAPACSLYRWAGALPALRGPSGPHPAS